MSLVSKTRYVGKGILGRADLFAALEEIADGKQRIEREEWFIARVVDQSLLDRADAVETHEELGMFLTPKDDNMIARLRLRIVTANQQVRQELTFKVRGVQERHFKESSVVAPDGLAEVLRLIPTVSKVHKTRYFYNTDSPGGEQWQMDVYTDANGDRSAWVKLDFEFASQQTTKLPAFPAGLTDVIWSKTEQKEEREMLSQVMKMLYGR